MPRRLLQQLVDSKEFTRLKAYKRRNTLNPDVWFSAYHNALTNRGVELEKFLPIRHGDEEEARRRRVAAAEAQLDRAGD